MTIQYLGHSCFLLSGKSARLLTDPYGDVGFRLPDVCCDAVTVSHAHYDHCNVAAVKSSPTVFDRAGTYRFRDLLIEGIESFHDDCRGVKRGRNVIFKIEMDGVTVCHLGDLGQPFDADLVKKIGKTDILMIPVGGNYTIDGMEAGKYVRAISPSVVIPMHYFVEGLTIDIGGVEQFFSATEYPIQTVGCTYEVPSPVEGKKSIVMERMESCQ